MNWFRWYVGTCADAKLHKASRLARVRRSVVISAWAAILEEARRHGDSGLVGEIDPTWLGCQIDEPARKCAAALAAMREVGLINETSVPAFSHRQFTSDSNERVKRYRDRREMNGQPRAMKVDRNGIIARDGGACLYCGREERLVIDHVIPVQLGGTDDHRNLITACKECNSGKAGRTPAQAGLKIAHGNDSQLDGGAIGRMKSYLIEFPQLLAACHGDIFDGVTYQNRTDSEQKERKKERAPSGADSGRPIVDLDGACFALGVGILGEKNRALVARLKNAKGTAEAMTILERARTRNDPLTFVTRCMHGRRSDPDEDAWAEGIGGFRVPNT